MCEVGISMCGVGVFMCDVVVILIHTLITAANVGIVYFTTYFSTNIPC